MFSIVGLRVPGVRCIQLGLHHEGSEPNQRQAQHMEAQIRRQPIRALQLGHVGKLRLPPDE